MEKHLTVYPISTGNELSIFADLVVIEVKIMDMHGTILKKIKKEFGGNSKINIEDLLPNTYIVEVVYKDERTGRSIFVKT